MGLSEDEQRRLDRLEREMAAQDPRWARRLHAMAALLPAPRFDPSWRALAACAGLLLLDGGLLRAAVGAGSTALMAVALLLFPVVPTPLLWRTSRAKPSRRHLRGRRPRR